MAQHIIAYVALAVVVGCLVLGFALEWRDSTERTRAPRQRADLDYARYAAEQAIREAERRAIRDILAVERQYRDMEADNDVIEGTAVEVRR
jgi:hypothetical protein